MSTSLLVTIICFMVFITLIMVSMLTTVKVPVVDNLIAGIMNYFYIRKNRKKNDIVHRNWRLTHYDLDNQDIRWESHDGGKLMAKLRIVYNKDKKDFNSFHLRWTNPGDVLEECNTYGKPKLLLELFGIPKNTYKILKPGTAKYKKIFGNEDYPIITIVTNFKFES